jgi:hypothetical protein
MTQVDEEWGVWFERTRGLGFWRRNDKDPWRTTREEAERFAKELRVSGDYNDWFAVEARPLP